MGELVDELDADTRRRRRARWLMVATVAAIVVFWLTGPFGVVLLVRGSSAGWVLIAVAVLAVIGGFVAFRASRRLVPASDFRIEADASQQPDPPEAGPQGSKALGWVMSFWGR